MRRRCERAIIILLALVIPAISAANPLPRSVLILDQSGPGIPGYLSIAAAFRAALNTSSEPRIAIYAENLDLTLFGGPQYDELLRTYLHKKYAEKPIGVMLAIGSAALEFALRLRADRWPDVLIAFAAVDDGTAARLGHVPNVTGTTIRLRFEDTVRAARALVPNLKRIALVGDPLERQTFRRHFARELPQMAPDMEIIDLLGMSVPDVRTRVASLPDDAAIVFTGIPWTAPGPGTFRMRCSRQSLRSPIVRSSSTLKVAWLSAVPAGSSSRRPRSGRQRQRWCGEL